MQFFFHSLVRSFVCFYLFRFFFINIVNFFLRCSKLCSLALDLENDNCDGVGNERTFERTMVMMASIASLRFNRIAQMYWQLDAVHKQYNVEIQQHLLSIPLGLRILCECFLFEVQILGCAFYIYLCCVCACVRGSFLHKEQSIAQSQHAIAALITIDRVYNTQHTRCEYQRRHAFILPFSHSFIW